jgi:hypothetical protein
MPPDQNFATHIDLVELRTELASEMRQLRTDLLEDFAELHAAFGRFEASLWRFLIIVLMGQTAVLLFGMFGMLQFMIGAAGV